MFWIVQCSACQYCMVYKPRKQTMKERRRKHCFKCKKRFKISQPLYTGLKAKEATELVKQLNLNAHQPVDQYDPAKIKFQSELEKAFNDQNDFSRECPGDDGPKATPNTQGEKPRAELDTWKGSAELTTELFFKLSELNYDIDEERYCISLPYDCGTFIVWSSGLVELYLDTSRGDYVAQAQAILGWLSDLAGKRQFMLRHSGAEYTINAPCGSNLAKAIAKTLPTGTKLAWLEGTNKLKIYRKGDGCETYRVEANDLPVILGGAVDLLREVLPDMAQNERVYVMQFDVHEKEIQAIKGLTTRAGETLQTLQVQTTELDSQIRDVGLEVGGVGKILEAFANLQEVQTKNLVQITYLNDQLNHKMVQVEQGMQELIIQGGHSGHWVGGHSSQTTAKMQELNGLLDYIGEKGLSKIKEVVPRFGWTNSKANRLLQDLMKIGEVERTIQKSPGRGRPSYVYHLAKQYKEALE